MGLFDESDSDNDAATSSYNASEAVGDDNEDEDPLDAYMKSIESTNNSSTIVPAAAPSSSTSDASLTASKSKSNKDKTNFGGGRLDVDAEDEATSHWEIVAPVTSSSSSNENGSGTAATRGGTSNLLLDKYYDATKMPGQTTTTTAAAWEKSAVEAHSGMSNTFVRAGSGVRGGIIDKGKKYNEKRKNGNGDQADYDDDGDNDDDIDDDDIMQDYNKLQKVKEEQHLLMLHQEVDPLERIDHKLIRYEAFERVFYHPTNTSAGHAWRKEHDVVCSPSSFDPILGFGELSGSSSSSCLGGGMDGENRHESSTASAAVFPEELLRAIAQSGYDSPTLVQSQTLSVALSGRDALITVRSCLRYCV